MTYKQEQAIKAICAAVVLGYDEQEKPVHLSAEEARKAIAAYQSVLTPEPCGCDSSKVNVRPYPDILSEDENKSILGEAESLWRDLQGNRLGGYSGGNRPFYILHAFKAVIEKYGRRDVGLSWSKNDLENPSPSPKPAS